MSDWHKFELDQFADVLDNLRIPVNEEERTRSPGNTPYYGANGLQGYINGWLFDEPLILIAEDGGYFDEYSTRPVAYKIEGKSWVNNHAHILRPKESFDFDYVFYSLQHKNITPFIKGGTRAKLNQKELREIEIYAPKQKFDQCQISEILSTTDQTIEKTEALIEKYQQIKAGLMHDLFTRGIGADGKLRPPREQAPELYQQTPIGWIPKEWGLSKLKDFLVDNPTNGIYKSADQIGDGTLMIGQTAFTKERSIDFALCRRGVISENEKKQYAVSENNILITRVFATVDGVGLPTLVPHMHERAVFESNMMRLRVDDEKISPLILFERLRNSKVRKLIVAGANASNQVSINQKTLNALPVPLVGGDEQSKIVNKINSYNRKYSIEKMNLTKLKQQKSGLMHDLLTGKVQVNTDHPEATHA